MNHNIYTRTRLKESKVFPYNKIRFPVVSKAVLQEPGESRIPVWHVTLVSSSQGINHIPGEWGENVMSTNYSFANFV